MKNKLIQLTSITIGAVAVLCTLPLLPLVWLWVVVKGEEW